MFCKLKMVGCSLVSINAPKLFLDSLVVQEFGSPIGPMFGVWKEFEFYVFFV